MRIIGLALATILTIATLRTAQAHVPTWPSISPSYRCDNGVSAFVLTNVGTNMTAGMPWQVATTRGVVENGVYWIAAGQSSEWRYNAPHIELTFSYMRPDNGQRVDLAQTCQGAQAVATPTPEPTPTPVGTPEFAGQGVHWWYLPWVTP